jgi:hypothetical protein
VPGTEFSGVKTVRYWACSGAPVLPNHLCASGIVRFEVFTAVTMKNVVFWDIKPQFVLHRRHITSPLQSTAS